MVANISPAAACLKETHSTLAFAQRAKMIKNKVCSRPGQVRLRSLLRTTFMCLLYMVWHYLLSAWTIVGLVQAMFGAHIKFLLDGNKS